jgi:anti-sigma regulatory factor (Ser/Thr protein kinase)/anti-anti-sigma regulatory factor
VNGVGASVDDRLADGLLLVELWGELTLSTASTVRATLLKCFADVPDGVIVDVSRLRVRSRAALSVFPTLSRQHAPPGLALVLSGLSAPAWMSTDALDIGQFESVESALHALSVNRVVPRRHATVRLAATMDAPARARAFVRDACVTWHIDELASRAALVMSELVTNAVEHAGTEMVVTASQPHSYLHLAVRDGSRAAPVPSQVDPHKGPSTVERGRGLHLVDVHATAWGSMPTERGKLVWATLRAVPVASHPSA